ncbi:MAG: hypothetical protein QOJ99_267 [Bryobacterales bacterium]|jgi:hypothetical protein|nr:hypothetical protein [Bryobacterales bacterium]
MWHSRLALVAFLTSSAFAQTFRGDMAGTVSDSTHAALVNAAVKPENPQPDLAEQPSPAAPEVICLPNSPPAFTSSPLQCRAAEPKR